MRNISKEEMVKHIGEEKYREINEANPGCRHYFPKIIRETDIETRNRLIYMEVRAGMTYQEAAEMFDLSPSTIYQIVAESRPNG